MHKQQDTPAIPDYLVKTTLGMSILAILMISPFCVNSFIAGRYHIGILTLIITVVSIFNAFYCARGQYIEKLNLYGIAPPTILAMVFNLLELGVVGSYWAYFGMLALYSVLPKRSATATNIIYVGIIIPLAWTVLEQDIAIRFSTVLIGLGIHAYMSTHIITKQYYMLKEQAVTDTLTGLNNRSLLQNSLEHAIQQQDRSDTDMTLIMLDLDNFKKINDELGHDVGDSVLKSVGAYLLAHFRASDVVFRIGGEEFLALIYNSDESDGLLVAEKLCREIEQLPLIPGRTVTTSIGVSGLQPGMEWEEWMKDCDEKLYRAKANGRNQVVS